MNKKLKDQNSTDQNSSVDEGASYSNQTTNQYKSNNNIIYNR